MQATAQLVFVHARELDVPGVGLHLVAEGQEGFGQLQVQGFVVVLGVLGIEGRALGGAQVFHGACRVHAVVAWQPFVKGFEQFACGHAVVFGQGDSDVGPERAVGAQAAAAGVLVPQKTPLSRVFLLVLQPANGGLCGCVGQLSLVVQVQAQQFPQHGMGRVTRVLRDLQARTGHTLRGVQALLGQPLRAHQLRSALRVGYLLRELSPLLAQQVAAQMPRTVELLVLIQCVGVVHHPKEIVLSCLQLGRQVALQRHLWL